MWNIFFELFWKWGRRLPLMPRLVKQEISLTLNFFNLKIVIHEENKSLRWKVDHLSQFFALTQILTVDLTLNEDLTLNLTIKLTLNLTLNLTPNLTLNLILNLTLNAILNPILTLSPNLILNLTLNLVLKLTCILKLTLKLNIKTWKIWEKSFVQMSKMPIFIFK